ncbi:Acetokinase family-domain-containing protein [Cantharellus anzutake]|uniref:Acetokinase family-domain-containing protein n=1 Tax=Cantharellus anzutake TaxID=1750568 RepID=UPI001904C173|nr:Acetokinase family-domain-containing protein [Cantharellus anzutake]KAF8326864.1 Acetokinase family-domain-containing protein [Cantharellus anzutake]
MILALNCGSSSIKFKLFLLSDLQVLILGSASKVNSKGQKPVIKLVVHHDQGQKDETSTEEEKEGMEYDAVFQRTIELIEASLSARFHVDTQTRGETKARDVIKLVAHRVVHGGSQAEPMALWPGHEAGLELLDKLSEFAPLHNHRAVQVVKSCLEHLPSSKQVLLFDTLFHQTIPRHIYTYPIPIPPSPPLIPLRKYGAHGLSYASILSLLSAHLAVPASSLSLVIAHLGSGASVCCVKDGKSLDTSMGLTPLEGLPGGTRSGSVDPALAFHAVDAAGEVVYAQGGLKLSKGEMTLNKEAGLLAVAGTSEFSAITLRAFGNDTNASEEEKESSKLAYDLFLDRLINFVAPYITKILGSSPNAHLDGIVISGGIGERSIQLRRDLASYLAWIGVELDDTRNEQVGRGDEGRVVWEITKDDAKIKMFVCMTDEETQCARMAKDYIKEQEGSKIRSEH